MVAERKGWLDRLKAGLRKTGSSIATVFTGTQIDDALYEELEEALLMADTGVKATQHLLEDLKRRVKETKTTDPAAVKGAIENAKYLIGKVPLMGICLGHQILGIASGATMVVFPGGGYQGLAPHEGAVVGKWMAERGVTAVDVVRALVARGYDIKDPIAV